MITHTPDSSPDGGSIVRSVLVGLGAALLFLTGQRRSALVLGAAYTSIDVFRRLRQVAPTTPWGAALATQMASTNQGSSNPPPTAVPSRPREDNSSSAPKLEVERRPRSGSQPPEQRKPDDKKGQSAIQKDKSAVEKEASGIAGKFQGFMHTHPAIAAFVEKIGKDNIGMLAAFVSWSLLTSAIPIIVGLIAITGLFLRDPATQQNVINHLASATQGAFTKKEIAGFVQASTKHAGLLGVIGFLGVLWGGANVGGAFSTAFQAIFEVKGRSFIKEKLIDIGMIFVFTFLMLVIIAGTSAGQLLSGLVGHVPVPGLAWAVGTLISLISAFILFGAIFLVFPNIEPPFRFGNVWKGAIVSAVFFVILSQIWPLYAGFQHFNKYGAILAPLLILTAWIYFFSLITMLGAEVVAFEAIEQAKKEDRSVGPEPQESVPQHDVLRSQPSAS